MDCTQAQNEPVTLKEKISMLYDLEELGLYSFGKKNTTQCEGKQ